MVSLKLCLSFELKFFAMLFYKPFNVFSKSSQHCEKSRLITTAFETKELIDAQEVNSAYNT